MTRDLVLRLNGRTSANIQAKGAQIYRVSHCGHATDPQLRKVHLILQARHARRACAQYCGW